MTDCLFTQKKTKQKPSFPGSVGIDGAIQGHEDNFDQLVSLFEDASDHYGEYEEARLAEVRQLRNFDIIWGGHHQRISQLCHPPHAPCDTLYLVSWGGGGGDSALYLVSCGGG